MEADDRAYQITIAMEADDNKTDNRLSEPEVAYERTPKAALPIYSDEYKRWRRIADESHAKDFTAYPIPYTQEELEARILVAEADIAAGKVIAWEDLKQELERDFPWLVS